MSVLVKYAKKIRNNWKKSVFGAVALTYGASYAKDKYQNAVFMRAICEEAIKYGQEKVAPETNPRVLTVILNPAANRRKAKADFEKYCEPLFNLAGIMVNVVPTTLDGGPKEIMEKLGTPNAVVVAGGDGTISELITGLMREGLEYPIGIIPLGRTNTVGNKLFPINSKHEKVKQLTTATMAVIKGETEYKDAMKIEALETNDEAPGKPIYSIAGIEWGAYRDAFVKRDKYWFYGGLRDYATFIFNGYKNSLTWNCSGSVVFSPPCAGCKNCMIEKPRKSADSSGWSLRSMFMPKPVTQTKHKTNYSIIENVDCETTEERCFKTTDFKLVLSDLTDSNAQVPHLTLNLGTPSVNYTGFVSEGWNRVNGHKATLTMTIPARSIELIPSKKNISEKQDELQFSIDNEDVDVKPIRVTFVPKAVLLYCSNNSNKNAE